MNRLSAILPAAQVLVGVDATSKKRAFEEAGLTGRVSEEPLGVYRYAKGLKAGELIEAFEGVLRTTGFSISLRRSMTLNH